MIRYFLDEDLSQHVAAAARSLGLDVESAQELDRRSVDDAAQLLFAAERGIPAYFVDYLHRGRI